MGAHELAREVIAFPSVQGGEAVSFEAEVTCGGRIERVRVECGPARPGETPLPPGLVPRRIVVTPVSYAAPSKALA